MAFLLFLYIIQHYKVKLQARKIFDECFAGRVFGAQIRESARLPEGEGTESFCAESIEWKSLLQLSVYNPLL